MKTTTGLSMAMILGAVTLGMAAVPAAMAQEQQQQQQQQCQTGQQQQLSNDTIYGMELERSWRRYQVQPVQSEVLLQPGESVFGDSHGTGGNCAPILRRMLCLPYGSSILAGKGDSAKLGWYYAMTPGSRVFAYDRVYHCVGQQQIQLGQQVSQQQRQPQ